MTHIEEFWSNKKHFSTKELLVEKVKEYYGEEFISNYDNWKNNLEACNKEYRDLFLNLGYDKSYWEDMSYNHFCKNIINSMAEYINIKGDITSSEVHQLLGIMLEDWFYNQELKVPIVHSDKKSTLSSLLNSITAVKFKHK